MALRTVTIKVDTTARTIDVSKVRVGRGYDVKWMCNKDYPFTVEFGWDTPFVGENYHAARTPTKPFRIPSKVVQADAIPHGRRLRFKYTVAVYVPANPDSINPDWQNGEVWTVDPEIIIDPSP